MQRIKPIFLILVVLLLFLFVSSPLARALEPLDTFFTSQAYLTQISANRAWNDIRESPEIVIAVIDTGVDIDNPDLAENIWTNPDEIAANSLDDDHNGFVDDIHGWDFIADTNDVKPKFDPGFTKVAMNHGTLVAGVAAARGGNNVGVAGVTWKAQIMPLRVLDGAGSGDTLAVTKAIDYARENGADIINLSFIGNESAPMLELALQKAYQAGIFIVAAAGNELSEGEDMDLKPRYPVCHDGASADNWIVGVTAVDGNDRKASFSNFGNSCVDLSAPGVKIFSTQAVSPSHDEFQSPYGGFWTGTSVAAPQVAGAAALVKATNPNLSLAEWQRLILANTDNIEASNRQTPWQDKLGAGRLNVMKAVSAARQFSPQTVKAIDKFLLTGAGPRGGPHVRLFDLSGRAVLQFFAYPSEFTNGINVSSADLDGDGEREIITTPQGKYQPEVRIFDQWGNLASSFLAYAPDQTATLKAIPADMDGDGSYELVTALGKGAAPLVRIFTSSGKLVSEFFAYNQLFSGGINIAVADLDFDGKDDIITVPGMGTSPILRVFGISGDIKYEFMAGNPDEISGLTVGAWRDSLVVAAAAGPPLVRIYALSGHKKQEWLAYSQNFKGGVELAVGDLNNDDKLDVVTGPRAGGGPHLRIFSQEGNILAQWMAYNPAFRGGISVQFTKTD